MNLTGPLSKNYCLLFMYLSLIGLFVCLFCVGYVIYALIVGKNKGIAAIIFIIPSYLVIYITNRLLYNMCLQ